jgi:hypothetical protein
VSPDDFQQAWKAQTSQTRLTIDADLLVKEVRRNQRYFTAIIFWRDIREVGIALLLVPLWSFMGGWLSLPWTWYLVVPVLLWVAGYLLVDRMRHKRRPPEPGEPLRLHVENSLAEVEHQIRLLRNIFWWYLLPLALAILAFFGQVAWQLRSGGPAVAAIVSLIVIVALMITAGVYRLNQDAVRSELEPRRQELLALLVSLKDEAHAEG